MKWQLEARKLKRYPHFDSDISATDAEALVTDPNSVAKHSFYPFLLYTKRWNRWAEKGEKGEPKSRPIRYAARRDAYIFAYYRHLLAERYEKRLQQYQIDQCVLAYRKIIDPINGGGKCNIHFARDAFEKIKKLGDCAVVALDISKYFESLDHEMLRSLWMRLLECNKLPDDHFRVFKAITRYSFVDKMAVYERLGFFGDRVDPKTGKTTRGFLVRYDDIPRPQICDPPTFRRQIAGKGSMKSIIEPHNMTFGIPQGAPISDVLANIYLMDFDRAMNDAVNALGGFYCRYSDDILVAVPGDADQGKAMMELAQSTISKFGSQLVIKTEKSYIYRFISRSDGDLEFERILGHEGQGKNGLEYLGFRFDGKKAYIRDATLSNLWRKVTRSARREAIAAAKRYPNKSATEIKALFNYEKFTKNYGRVEEFDEFPDDIRKWTFWTYAQRASRIFGDLGKPILRQLAGHKRIIRVKLDEAIEQAVLKRSE